MHVCIHLYTLHMSKYATSEHIILTEGKVWESSQETVEIYVPTMASNDIPHAHLRTASRSPNLLLCRHTCDVSWHIFSVDFRPVFSMAFSRHTYDWLSPSYSFIFTFSSLLAFCLLLLLFFFSLELNFAILFLISLHFSVFFFNLTLVSPSPFLSFFLTSKTGGNLCLHLKSLS